MLVPISSQFRQNQIEKVEELSRDVFWVFCLRQGTKVKRRKRWAEWMSSGVANVILKNILDWKKNWISIQILFKCMNGQWNYPFLVKILVVHCKALIFLKKFISLVIKLCKFSQNISWCNSISINFNSLNFMTRWKKIPFLEFILNGNRTFQIGISQSTKNITFYYIFSLKFNS